MMEEDTRQSKYMKIETSLGRVYKNVPGRLVFGPYYLFQSRLGVARAGGNERPYG